MSTPEKAPGPSGRAARFDYLFDLPPELREHVLRPACDMRPLGVILPFPPSPVLPSTYWALTRRGFRSLTRDVLGVEVLSPAARPFQCEAQERLVRRFEADLAQDEATWPPVGLLLASSALLAEAGALYYGAGGPMDGNVFRVVFAGLRGAFNLGGGGSDATTYSAWLDGARGSAAAAPPDADFFGTMYAWLRARNRITAADVVVRVRPGSHEFKDWILPMLSDMILRGRLRRLTLRLFYPTQLMPSPDEPLAPATPEDEDGGGAQGATGSSSIADPANPFHEGMRNVVRLLGDPDLAPGQQRLFVRHVNCTVPFSDDREDSRGWRRVYVDRRGGDGVVTGDDGNIYLLPEPTGYPALDLFLDGTRWAEVDLDTVAREYFPDGIDAAAAPQRRGN